MFLVACSCLKISFLDNISSFIIDLNFLLPKILSEIDNRGLNQFDYQIIHYKRNDASLNVIK